MRADYKVQKNSKEVHVCCCRRQAQFLVKSFVFVYTSMSYSRGCGWEEPVPTTTKNHGLLYLYLF
jgi:hypothetical protein